MHLQALRERLDPRSSLLRALLEVLHSPTYPDKIHAKRDERAISNIASLPLHLFAFLLVRRGQAVSRKPVLIEEASKSARAVRARRVLPRLIHAVHLLLRALRGLLRGPPYCLSFD